MHYKLVSYKRKQLLTYIEIPYDVKIMITNKCMERNSGIFYMIQDFKNFKSKLGINPEEGKKDNDNDDYMERDLYDPSIVFMFHSKSEEKSKPGKGSNEEIPVDKLSDFVEFTKKEKNVTWKNNWRRKLDDSWMESPFTIDNLRWNSIIHYVEGSKFKKGFPDFYKMFSEDSNSDISKDVLLAKAAGSKTGKIKDKALRPKNISIDSDFNEARENEERKLAVYAKFEQNHDLKQLLSYTYPAKLIHFVRGSPAEPDNILMQIRKQLMATS